MTSHHRVDAITKHRRRRPSCVGPDCGNYGGAGTERIRATNGGRDEYRSRPTPPGETNVKNQNSPASNKKFCDCNILKIAPQCEIVCRRRGQRKRSDNEDDGDDYPEDIAPICLNGGSVTRRQDGTEFCTCSRQYGGTFCELFDPCYASSEKVCLNGGVCRPAGGGWGPGVSAPIGDDENSESSTATIDCICAKGFYGRFCQLIDRCLSLAPCQNSGYCRNIQIAPGIIIGLGGSAADATHNLGAGEESDYHCFCYDGYYGRNCSRHDPCSSTPCQNNGQCRNITDEEYVCRCQPGYHGDNCELYSPCADRPCLHGGMCNSIDGRYVCECTTGRFGRRCEHVNLCRHVRPCGEHAITCHNITDTSYKCICEPGWSGDNCTAYNPCHSSPCLNDGQCISVSSSYSLPSSILPSRSSRMPRGEDDYFRCECAADFWGELCEMLDPCGSSPCANGGTCTNTSSTSYSCRCSTGYYGDTCELSNACASASCGPHSLCVNTSSSTYRCDCPPTHFGDSCRHINGCYPVDSCRHGGRCVPVTTAVSTGPGIVSVGTGGGFYTCICASSSYSGADCSRFDPCNSNPCQNGGRCSVLSSLDEETFQCACVNRFSGPLCASRDVCYSSPCHRGATCVKLNQETALDATVPSGSTGSRNFRCVCPPGMYGRLCESVNPCADLPCRNGGKCNPTRSGFRCQCAAGFYGTACDSVDPCHQAPCLHDGTCVVQVVTSVENIDRVGEAGSGNSVKLPGSESGADELGYFCRCDIEYQGAHCEQEVPCSVHGKKCYNDGICMAGTDPALPKHKGGAPDDGSDSRNTYCLCPDGYFGFRCQNFDPCSTENRCINGGLCKVTENGMYYCACQSGFFGEHCELHRPCNIYHCKHNATCVHSAKSEFCYCKPGFTGKLCEHDVNECESQPCNNGGSCVDLPGRYSCICPDGFAGETCRRDDVCPNQTLLRAKGQFSWPSTTPGVQARIPCPRNPSNIAIRFCRQDAATDSVSWDEPDISRCSVTVRSAKEAVQHLQLYASHNLSDSVAVADAVILLQNILGYACTDRLVAEYMVTVIDNILDLPAVIVHDSNSTEKLLALLDSFLTRVTLKDNSANVTLVSNNFEIDVRHVHWTYHDTGTTYIPHIAHSVQLHLPPELFVREIASDRVKFMYFKTSKLFHESSSSLPSPRSSVEHDVISGSVGVETVGLKSCVTLSMENRMITRYNRCAFWDKSNREWSANDIETISYRGAKTLCCSRHMAFFTVISDASVAAVTFVSEDYDIMLASHAGLGLAIVIIFVILAMYAIISCLRRSLTSDRRLGLQIMQLLIASLAMNFTLLFAYNRYKISSVDVCRTVSLLAHYLTLSTFLWISIVCYNFLQENVVADRCAAQHCGRLRKECRYAAIAWILPVVPVMLSFVLDADDYIQDPERCFLSGTGHIFWTTYVLPMIIFILSHLVLSLLMFRSLSLVIDRKSTAIVRWQVVSGVLSTIVADISWTLFLLSMLKSFSANSVNLHITHCSLQAVNALTLLLSHFLLRRESCPFYTVDCISREQKCLPARNVADQSGHVTPSAQESRLTVQLSTGCERSNMINCVQPAVPKNSSTETQPNIGSISCSPRRYQPEIHNHASVNEFVQSRSSIRGYEQSNGNKRDSDAAVQSKYVKTPLADRGNNVVPTAKGSYATIIAGDGLDSRRAPTLGNRDSPGSLNSVAGTGSNCSRLQGLRAIIPSSSKDAASSRDELTTDDSLLHTNV